MKMIGLLTIVALCLVPIVQAGWVIPLSDEDIEDVVDDHNQYRMAVGANAMQKLKWNSQLAQFAASSASQCNFEHTSYDARSNVVGFSYIGENIWTIAGDVEEPNITRAVADWAAEEKDYDLYSNTCSAMCGHYTQIVWSSTTDIGCAMAQCDSVGGFSDQPGYLIFCNYGPGGNIADQAPYEKANSDSDVGSKCQEFNKTTDANGLCDDSGTVPLSSPIDEPTTSAPTCKWNCDWDCAWKCT